MVKLPRHIAVVMDGNGRWAQKRFLPRTAGHRSAVLRVRELIEFCSEEGVQALTLYAFSTENWRRPDQEVSYLMRLLLNNLKKETKALHENNVQVKIIGDRAELSADLQDVIQHSEGLTAENTGVKLRLAVNYGARWDIVQAINTCVAKQPGDPLTPEMIDEHISTADCPEVDLLIRTGGTSRLSNFLLWQLAYSELYFTDTLFPDFSRQCVEKAIEWFSTVERRYGCTSEQVNTHEIMEE